jgi:hypothetical protein
VGCAPQQLNRAQKVFAQQLLMEAFEQRSRDAALAPSSQLFEDA